MKNKVGKISAALLALSLVTASGFAQDAIETIYLNATNMSVALGESHDEAVATDPNRGPFQNLPLATSLGNVIDAPSADAGELHKPGSTHVWVSGGHLELDFDFGLEYDLLTLHFWNYHSEGYDVDDVTFTFYNALGELIGTLDVQPVLGNATGSDADPVFADHYDLDFPGNVRYVNAWITGTNGEVDFNNIGFTAVRSENQTAQPVAPTSAGRSAADTIESGLLRVTDTSGAANDDAPVVGAIQVILDSSGSMWQTLDGRYRYQVAGDVLADLVTDVLPPEVPFSLRVFGNRQADVCRTDLEVALAPLDASSVAGLISAIEPQPFAGTPLAESIRLVRQDLADAGGPRTVILITDGEESCDGDVDAAIKDLRTDGFDVVLNIIGFDFDAVDVEAARERYRNWAEMGGGQYFDAASAGELASALERSIAPGYEVLDATGTVVARGTVGDDGVELDVGTYDVRVMTDPEMMLRGVEVKVGTTNVDIGAEGQSP